MLSHKLSIIFLGILFRRIYGVYKSETLYTSSNTYLYNLTSDPYEDVNIYSEDDSAASLVTLESRRSYWSDLTITTNGPDTTNMTSTWDTCGRVCSWLTDDNVPFSIDQKYYYEDAPHIVFVLVDDWGYNDFGKRSTYLNWTTPNIDSLADNGILLENFYTAELCGPSRASLLTGRYALRVGVSGNYDELPLSELTLAQELKSAGYRNYLIGKWHLGLSTTSYWPLQRGFDYFYGYLNGYSTYWSKEYEGYIDLFENNDYVTDTTELDSSYHSAYLLQDKAEDVIKSHATNYDGTPMFLYYAMHLIHYPWTAPSEYLERCLSSDSSDFSDAYLSDDALYNTDNVAYNYCAMNVMLDEAIANLTCTLEKYDMADNTILIIAGDNGGESTVNGNNYPYRGYKDTAMRGAFANTAIIHSTRVPAASRGSTYYGNFHIVDFLPTLMNVATNGSWTGSLFGGDLDGIDLWDSITGNSDTERNEIVFISHTDGVFVGQYDNMKYIYHVNQSDLYLPKVFFSSAVDTTTTTICTNPSLVDVENSVFTDSRQPFGINTVVGAIGNGMSGLLSQGMDMSFLFFAFTAMFSILAIGMIITYHTTAIKSPQGLDRYASYKNSGETQSLL